MKPPMSSSCPRSLTSSVAVLEAMRFGKPVIDSAKDGNSIDLVPPRTDGPRLRPLRAGSLAAARWSVECRARYVPRANWVRRASALLEEQTPQTAAAALCDVLDVIRRYENRLEEAVRRAKNGGGEG